MMQLSIVTTVYFSENTIKEFYARVIQSAQEIFNNFELIIVDDGSQDKSLDICLTLQKKDPRITVVELSKNFGHHKAIMKGLSLAKGKYVFLIDSDLEEDPELLKVFYEVMVSNKKTDVVYGVQERRKGRLCERITGSLFYKFMSFTTKDFKLPKNLSTIRLMTKDYVKKILLYQESEIMIFCLFHAAGFVQIPVTFKKNDKRSTRYTLRKKIDLLLNSITSFSQAPLICIFYLGAMLSLTSFSLGLFFIMRYFFLTVPISGWLSTILSIWFLGGIIILFLGIIAIYIAKIFLETKNRPFPFVKNLYQGSDRYSDE